MRKIFLKTTATIFFVLLSIGASDAAAQTMRSGVSNVQVRTVLDRISRGAVNLQAEINRSRYDDMANNADDRIANQLSIMTTTVHDMRRAVSGRWSRADVSSELNTILDSARRIDRVLQRNTSSPQVNIRWASVRADVEVLAGYYGMTANWETYVGGNNGSSGSSTPVLRASRSQVRNVLRNMRSQSIMLKSEINRERYDDATNNADDRVANNLDVLTQAIDRLNRSSFTFGSRDDAAHVETILDRSSRIDRILSRNTTGSNVNRTWMDLRRNVDTLAGYYGVSANYQPENWNNNTGRSGALTGTYRLNVAQSDNVRNVIDRSLGYYSAGSRDNVRRTLERRLASPDVIAIERNGRSITLASSLQPQVTFDADGVTRTEANARGRQVTTRVSFDRDELEIDTSGDRVNDFNVKFNIESDGQLRVTRRIYLENRDDTVTVNSVYDRIATVADWNIVRSGGTTGYNYPAGTTDDYYVPNNVTLTATLREPISTKTARTGDRFTLDVSGPANYQGAVIEGRISSSESSGRVSGRANLQMDLETISYGGRTYRFAGIVQSVSALNGDSVTVNNEGTIRDNSQTNKTITRAGIGALLGAVIGAIADGGSGAAIGAGVGAGAGAGSVLVTGRDNLELDRGSVFTIISSAPAGTTRSQRYP